MALSRAAAGLLVAGLVCGAAFAAEAPRPVSLQKPPAAIEAERYVVRKAAADNLALPAPVLPDLTHYTREAIEAKIPRKTRATVDVRRMVQEPALHDFVGGQGRLGEWAARQSGNPVAIFVSGGLITPKELAKALPAEQFAEVSPGIFILRLPLVIEQGAALHIGPETKEFRLSQERGAFLVNDDLLFITGTRVFAWREAEKAPATFQQEGQFRPFIVSWGGSQTYIADSVVAHLGYEASKSYGVSITQYSSTMDAKLHRSRPTGWIVNSEFYDCWYGLYTYEADDVVVVGNKYHDNRVYGIDPHDRSRRLIIANNLAWGPTQKHGIIISREVNDSWIFRNKTFKNRLAGIVLDRNCSNNVVAYNETYDNQGDGLTIYESPNNLLWSNRSVGNQRHGFRLRNSVDIRLYGNVAVGNQLAGIYGHIKDLSGTDRDLKLDPFELNISMVVVGGQLTFNGSGPVAIDQPLSVELYGIDLLAPSKKNGIQLTGVLGEYQAEILDILVRQRAAVVIEPADPQNTAQAQ